MLYTSSKPLKKPGVFLKLGDNVEFKLSNGAVITYRVYDSFLKNDRGLNDSIFVNLNIDKHEIARKYYFKKPVVTPGEDWPCSYSNDYASLTNLVIALFEMIEGTVKLFEPTKVKISKKGLQSVYPLVCKGWQGTIKAALIESLLEDEVSVSLTVLEQAFSEADTKQKAALEEHLNISTHLKLRQDSTSDLEIGQALVVNDAEAPHYNGQRLLRTYAGFVSLDDASSTWCGNPQLKGLKLSKGSKIVVEIK